VAVLLHGFPGNERSFDLAQALRRAGHATVVFHYRGSWGVGGIYTWRHVLEDSASVVASLRETEMATRYRLDPKRIAVVGHSMGGFAALMTAASDPEIYAVVSIAAFDLGSVASACRQEPKLRAGYLEAFRNELLPLHGTTAEALLAEAERFASQWRLSGLAPALAERPLLLIAGSRDQVAPVGLHHTPLVQRYTTHPVPLLEYRVFHSDHTLADHRVALARCVIEFLGRSSMDGGSLGDQ
jgi:pimeloyl-ACP methyl ester carboxylesterase